MRMTAENFLTALTEPQPDMSEMGPVAYAAYHPQLGVFVGIKNGMAYWSALHDDGQSTVALFDSPETGDTYLQERALGGHSPDDLEYFAVTSGHWRDLAAVGLPVEGLAFNEAIDQATHPAHATCH